MASRVVASDWTERRVVRTGQGRRIDEEMSNLAVGSCAINHSLIAPTGMIGWRSHFPSLPVGLLVLRFTHPSQAGIPTSLRTSLDLGTLELFSLTDSIPNDFRRNPERFLEPVQGSREYEPSPGSSFTQSPKKPVRSQSVLCIISPLVLTVR